MATRAEHRRATLLALNAAALDAIEADGLEVPLADIAERAGVARRTVYRWVDTRDDLLFVHPHLWLDTFARALRDNRDQPLATRIDRACAAVCADIAADPEPVVRSVRLAMAHPELLRGYASINNTWIERLSNEIARDDGATTFRSRALAAAVMGMIDAALFTWVERWSSGSIADVVAEGLGYLAPLLAERPAQLDESS